MGISDRLHSYHADANALGGALVHPFSKIIPSQAQVSLPAAGGFTLDRVGAFNFDELVSCGGSSCHASGSISVKSGAWSTLVTAVIENLNLLNIVTADKIISHIATEHPLIGHTPTVTFAGSHFVNLRIGGFLVEPQINLELLTPEKDPGGQPWLRNTKLLAAAREQHRLRISSGNTPEWVERRYGWIKSDDAIAEHGQVLTSLVDGFTGTIPGNSYGHIIDVPEFGKFYFGELSVRNQMYRLTMLRAELGCAVHGGVSGGTTGSNGGTVG